MVKTLIVSGGSVNLNFLKTVIEENKFNNIIGSDKGLEALDKCNIKPNYIIGDFDSINSDILNKYLNIKEIKIIRLKPEKDFTDTHMALKLAIDLKSTQITIVGGIGTRIDHTMANISILKEALDNNVSCKLLNENNDISLINKSISIIKDSKYPYISLIPLTTLVDGITLKGFKYNLNNAKMKIGQSIGVSNEQIKEKATIDIKEGILIIIKSKD